MDWLLACWCSGNRLGQAEFGEYAAVQSPFRFATPEILLVVQVQALPVFRKLSSTVFAHLLEDVGSTTRDFATLFQAMFRFSVLGLAEHKIIVKVLAVGTNEESSRL